MRNTVRFLFQFFHHPITTGAIVPSSPYLARKVVSAIDLSEVHSAVEYGPGCGSLTSVLLEALPESARFFAIERNPEFALALRNRLPQATVYLDCVTNVKALCRAEGMKGVDCVLSGLPWASFSDEHQDRILESMIEVLKPGGQFVCFSYLPSLMIPGGVRFRRKLQGLFSQVRVSHPVWRNVPPAIVYHCQR